MKRMIACEKCAKRVIPKYAGEWFIRVHGTAKADMLCDWCVGGEKKIIRAGDKCAAESMGVSGRVPYYEWEGEYLTDLRRE